LIELKNSPNFVRAYKMEEHKRHSIGDLDGPGVVEDLGGWVGLVENTQGPSRSHLNFLTAILGRFKSIAIFWHFWYLYQTFRFRI
jgi:hypothetical protein